jgi:hypothetical protein
MLMAMHASKATQDLATILPVLLHMTAVKENVAAERERSLQNQEDGNRLRNLQP